MKYVLILYMKARNWCLGWTTRRMQQYCTGADHDNDHQEETDDDDDHHHHHHQLDADGYNFKEDADGGDEDYQEDADR